MAKGEPLQECSVSFFDYEKHETAITRWSRASTRAAKVGKGLSKNGRGQKLALQHWLEAIDACHRYGHNLRFYYNKWLHCQSKEPFFYWLDVGEGKDINLVEKCPRSKLQEQCIKYLSPMERKAYEVIVEDGKLLYKQSREVLDTIEEPKGSKWIFVLSTSMALYVGQKKKGAFQHSSFLAGGATSSAGRIVVDNGIIKAAWPHSGHYRPTPENFQDFISFLKRNDVDVTDVKMDPTDDEEDRFTKKNGVLLRSISELSVKEDGMGIENMEQTTMLQFANRPSAITVSPASSLLDGCVSTPDVFQMVITKQYLSDEEEYEENREDVPKKIILLDPNSML